MAKSLRSKWRRKCRAVKRERYGQKELERLKRTLALDKVATGENETSSLVTITDASALANSSETNHVEQDEQMNEVDMKELEQNAVEEGAALRSRNGSYPVWMHQRKIRKIKNVKKKNEKKKQKRLKKSAKKVK